MTGPIVIAGAGPTGLALALMLRQLGLDVTVYEASPTIDTRPRAAMIHARVLEILDRLGLINEFLNSGLMQHAIAFVRPDGLQLAIEFDTLPTRFPCVLNLRQPDIELLLTRALLDMGVVVHRGTTVEGFFQFPDSVQIRLNFTSGGCQTIEAAWLVGCDGARSTVRTQLGARFEGETIPYPYILGEGTPTVALAPGSVSTMLVTTQGVVSWLPFRDGGVRVAGPGRAITQDANRPDLTAAEFLVEQARLVTNPNLRVTNIDRVVAYRVHARLASHWGEGRVWLAGDAAHVHPPAGGQALNLGIVDAEAIAQRLTSGLAFTIGFDSYEAERRSVAEATLAQVAMMPLVAALRDARTEAEIEALRQTLADMAIRLSHLATDYNATGPDRLGSTDPKVRQVLRVGRRVDRRLELTPDETETGCWKIPGMRIWMTPDRHVRKLQRLLFGHMEEVK
ncbi:hypothetical protein D5041_01830 [Verminephrobacter aporrectodeae subsp. tuberculatae]|uniref:FAD-dependent oxidoreductase n=1 Tax=Verminephrobacter aporrectodeae TaxID=1110389 RepID=UPI0022377090|nr:FAD-dependent monooxygenase [Verminephrobacter aporrectodeae]MCW5222378.1 hypothetical protein [Verminephrobacter aporrectodeae subsp. tuberculatae]MCW5287842.1 hypothetical protein [Verminephrobacter aporrectodeae subsp. tuberculatae]